MAIRVTISIGVAVLSQGLDTLDTARAASIASSATIAARRSGGSTAQITGSEVTAFPALGRIALTCCR